MIFDEVMVMEPFFQFNMGKSQTAGRTVLSVRSENCLVPNSFSFDDDYFVQQNQTKYIFVIPLLLNYFQKNDWLTDWLTDI